MRTPDVIEGVRVTRLPARRAHGLSKYSSHTMTTTRCDNAMGGAKTTGEVYARADDRKLRGAIASVTVVNHANPLQHARYVSTMIALTSKGFARK